MAEQSAGGPEARGDNRDARGDRDSRGRRDSGRGRDRDGDKSNYLERVVAINRVSKVVKGGRRFSFTALVIVGDGHGMVGVGYGKAKEVPAAIAKGVEEARKGFFRVPLIGGTVTHPVQGEAAAGVVLLRPASPGTGVIAGGAVRAVLECAGVHDILAKSLGSDNAINVVHATVAALKLLQRPEEVAARRGLPIEDVAPAGMLKARRESDALASAAKIQGHERQQHNHEYSTENHPGAQHHRGPLEAAREPAHPGSAADSPLGDPRGQPTDPRPDRGGKPPRRGGAGRDGRWR